MPTPTTVSPAVHDLVEVEAESVPLAPDPGEHVLDDGVRAVVRAGVREARHLGPRHVGREEVERGGQIAALDSLVEAADDVCVAHRSPP